MSSERKVYKYVGAVKRFDACINPYWTATTWAVSEKKALNNLAYRYKREHNMSPSAKISLPGKIVEVVKGEYNQ